MIHPFTKQHHGVIFHGLEGLWASVPCPKIPYLPQVQLGPNLVCCCLLRGGRAGVRLVLDFGLHLDSRLESSSTTVTFSFDIYRAPK